MKIYENLPVRMGSWWEFDPEKTNKQLISWGRFQIIYEEPEYYIVVFENHKGSRNRIFKSSLHLVASEMKV